MQNYDEIMKELRDMRGHYDDGFSLLEKQRIVELYWPICGKRINNPSCPDCYRDAFLEIFTTLQKLGKLPEEKHYILEEGKMLHIFGSSEYLIDVTDEQAEKFLAQLTPEQAVSQIKFFKVFPEDWEERVKKRKMKDVYKQAAQKRAETRKAKNTETT